MPAAGREDFDPRRGGNLGRQDLVLRHLRHDGSLSQSVAKIPGRQQPLHHAGPFELPVELVGAIVVGHPAEAAIDLPSEEPVAVHRRVVVAGGRPEGPFAITAGEERRQLFPRGQKLKGLLRSAISRVF